MGLATSWALTLTMPESPMAQWPPMGCGSRTRELEQCGVRLVSQTVSKMFDNKFSCLTFLKLFLIHCWFTSLQCAAIRDVRGLRNKCYTLHRAFIHRSFIKACLMPYAVAAATAVLLLLEFKHWQITSSLYIMLFSHSACALLCFN